MTEETLPKEQIPDLTEEEQEIERQEQNSSDQDGDPLDEIVDVEELRNKA